LEDPEEAIARGRALRQEQAVALAMGLGSERD
jgi:hypothetical protein